MTYAVPASFIDTNRPLVERMSRRFWWEYLSGHTSEAPEDVRQRAWLALLEHPDAVAGLRPKRILWDLRAAYEFRGTPKRWQWRQTELCEDAKAETRFEAARARHHTQALWEFRTLRLTSVSQEGLEYLYQNLWAIGTGKTVEALVRRLEGAGPRGRNGAGGADRNTLLRALPRIRQAFPTREALLGPSRALWLHPSCESALAAYSGLAARDCRGRLKRLVTPEGQPTADARAFYDRQLALGWGRGAV